jgi:hypothetical protein
MAGRGPSALEVGGRALIVAIALMKTSAERCVVRGEMFEVGEERFEVGEAMFEVRGGKR